MIGIVVGKIKADGSAGASPPHAASKNGLGEGEAPAEPPRNVPFLLRSPRTLRFILLDVLKAIGGHRVDALADKPPVAPGEFDGRVNGGDCGRGYQGVYSESGAFFLSEKNR